MDELNLSIGMDEDGDYYFFKDQTSALPVQFVELILELQKQNPEFYRHWASLATNYVLVGNSVAEA